jgi:hypothetical protein
VGRVRSYRQRVAFEMRSVWMKSVVVLIERVLREEFARSPLEAEVLARASVGWLSGLGLAVVPGQVRLSVPVTRSRRHAASMRGVALVTAVDVVEDTWAWEAWGLSGMQRSRVVRWLLEVRRAGGWASLSEVAAWANVTPQGLANRLQPLRERGVWLPHVGGAAERVESPGVLAWLLDRFLSVGSVDEDLVDVGVTPSVWAGVLAGVVLVRGAGDAPVAGLAARLGWSAVEVEQVRVVLKRHARAARRLAAPAAFAATTCSAGPMTASSMRDALLTRYGFSSLAADLYLEWLRELVARLQAVPAVEGEVVVFAIDATEGARAKLSEARLVPVRLSFFTDQDALLGPRGEARTRVSEMKFARIERFAKQARAQGALLTLPDLAVLLGMHVDAVRHHIAQHPDVVVPTRGRMRDIGRGVTHKTWIVELYLQMHSESEIVERTQHAYESVEAYLREFVRVITLADRGMNAVMIRRVTQRSLSLVNAYLELYDRYDRPEHHFRLSQLRQAFTLDDVLSDKKGGRLRSRTEDPGA